MDTGRVTGRGAAGAGLAPEVAAALGRIGNNVNQMARAANVAEREGEVSPLTVQAVEALRLEVAQLRNALLKHIHLRLRVCKRARIVHSLASVLIWCNE